MVLRQLLSRLLFSLGIDAPLSMEILAFWLWIERNGHVDFLARIDSFSNNHLREIASAGNSFIEALFLKSSDFSIGRSSQISYFQKEALAAITFYLNNVCYKVLEDLQEIAKMKETTYSTSQGHHGNRRDKEARMSTKDLLAKIRAAYVNTNSEEGTSSRSMMSSNNQILEDGKHTTDENQSTYGLVTLMDTLNIRDRPDHAAQIRQHSSVPSDERTLFVTFSNGYPFTKDELYEFFMRHYGDVEDIIVEEPMESRPPLYAHVTFFSQATLFHVLDGNKRVKFMMRGKHLWARQFVPKKKKVEE
ncbi:hypothetical protein PR202_gb12693 [Eleusine coracana subsp. coracana]|uniref:RRM domain-containing protein n=1 Tax=Eleusine coracana subsp. coracana TaxID=191504 RepID=A0AAV5ERS4_ELECO|nr:hypothetical protein PR202_gb12693 [Eleusine coracana subsp. coracana]